MSDPVSQHVPQDLDAEQAILGAMISARRGIDAALTIRLTAKHFMRPAHGLIFDAIMHQSDSDAVDEMTVVQRLRDQRCLAEAGGSEYVMSLYERTPSVANSTVYALAVRKSAVRRALVKRGTTIQELGWVESDRSPDELVSEAGRLIDEMAERVSHSSGAQISTMADHLLPFYETMSDRRERGAAFAGLSTGLSVLDTRWGGLQGGRFYVIAGRPGMGKSALGMGIAESVVFGSGVDVYSANLEMTPTEQAGRLIARAGSLDLHRLTNALPTDDDFVESYAVISRVSECARLLHTDESSKLTADDVCRRARMLNRKLKREGRALGLVLVDYLQKLKKPKGLREDQDYAAVTYASGLLKELALELDVPVVALCQLNRSVEARPDKKPNMSDLKGSGDIEQDADIVALILRPEYYQKEDTPLEYRGMAIIDTAKSRIGESGEDVLRWEGRHVRFSDYVGSSFYVGGVS